MELSCPQLNPDDGSVSAVLFFTNGEENVLRFSSMEKYVDYKNNWGL